MTNTDTPLSLPFEQWPEIDRELWQAACAPSTFLGNSTDASTWSDSRRRIVRQSYGQWLAWLKRHGILDAGDQPGSRITQGHFVGFLRETGDRVAPCSLLMMVGAIIRFLDVVEPEADWSWIREIYNRLKFQAKPSRKKRNEIVPIKDLYDLGIRLMDGSTDAGPYRHSPALQFRDGLMLSLLAARPVRMRNMSRIVVGENLRHEYGRYVLVFSPEETKTGNPIALDVPSPLGAYLEEYLRCQRRYLLSRGPAGATPTKHLWVGRDGGAINRGIYEQIKSRTKDEFGFGITPHRFRDCLATSIAIEDPVHVRMATVILGHTTMEMTEKHYNQATSLEAARAYQNELQAIIAEEERM